MIWSLLIEGLLVLLLTATIYFAIRLNKRLTVLRVEKEQLEKFNSKLLFDIKSFKSFYKA